MTDEIKIKTLHPEGKNGVNISKDKYDSIRTFILTSLQEGTMTYQDLNKKAVRDLQDSFNGRVPWYLVTVKLDLEARGEIERIPGTSPHELRIRDPAL